MDLFLPLQLQAIWKELWSLLQPPISSKDGHIAAAISNHQGTIAGFAVTISMDLSLPLQLQVIRKELRSLLQLLATLQLPLASNYQENTTAISVPHCSQLWPPLGKEIQLALGG